MKNKAGSCLAVMLMVTGCTGYGNERASAENVSYILSESGKKAFAESYTWNLDPANTDIQLADTIDQAKVVSLGGYMGTGVPCPFEILAEKEESMIYPSSTDPNPYDVKAVYTDVPFTIHIPANMEKITLFHGGYYMGKRKENGDLAFYCPYFRFTCDDDNRYFYEKDGILYRKSDDEPVDLEEGVYQGNDPVNAFSTLDFRNQLKGKYILEREEDIIILDIFSAFERMFINAGYYINGSLYQFEAAEIISEDASVWTDQGRNSASIILERFSDFTAETSAEPYVITVDENTLALQNDENTVTFQRDDDLASQFSYELVPGQFSGRRAGLYDSHYLVRNHFETDAYDLKIDPAGTMTILIKGETPLIYKGICTYSFEKILYYRLTKLGGGNRPYTGCVQVDQDTDTFTLIEEDIPLLIPEGEDTVTFDIKK